jgi:hypothetical protein
MIPVTNPGAVATTSTAAVPTRDWLGHVIAYGRARDGRGDPDRHQSPAARKLPMIWRCIL